MIIGNPIMLGGGSNGGLDPSKPLIHVNAPLGSTVDIILSSLIIATIPPSKAFPNVDGETADYYYSCSSTGSYTVTGTLGSNTTSETVVVSEIVQYNVELSYAFWLYKDGVIFSGLGAWHNVQSTSNTGSVLASTYDDGPCSKGYFSNAVPLRNYGTTLHVIASITRLFSTPTSYPFRCGAFSSALGDGNYGSEVDKAVATTAVTAVNNNYVNYTVDISGLTNTNYYLGVLCIAAATVKQVYITD